MTPLICTARGLLLTCGSIATLSTLIRIIVFFRNYDSLDDTAKAFVIRCKSDLTRSKPAGKAINSEILVIISNHDEHSITICTSNRCTGQDISSFCAGSVK